MSKTVQFTKRERERVTAETLRSIRRRDVSINATNLRCTKKILPLIYIKQGLRRIHVTLYAPRTISRRERKTPNFTSDITYIKLIEKQGKKKHSMINYVRFLIAFSISELQFFYSFYCRITVILSYETRLLYYTIKKKKV